MGELHGDEMRREYEPYMHGAGAGETPRLWLVEDGETHWYVADHAYEALREHETGFEAEAFTEPGEGVEITLVKPGERVTVRMEDPSDAEGYPAHWRRFPTPNAPKEISVEATAAEWAWHHAGEGPIQIATTCI